MQAITTALAPTAMNAYTAHVIKYGVMFGFDAQYTHYNPYEQILNSTNISYLQQKWATPTYGQILFSPAVANGLVYIGSGNSKLYALDALTGKLK